MTLVRHVFFTALFTSILSASTALAHDGAHDANQYQVSKQWQHLATGEVAIGKSHGEIDVAEDGTFYLSVMSTEDIQGGIHLYSAKGDKIGEVPNAPDDFHGFVINRDKQGQELIYGASLREQKWLKMRLNGEILLEVDAQKSIPRAFHSRKGQALKLTAIDVDSDGYVYVVDGYSLDYIHKFTPEGKYLASFGGQAGPYQFNNCHKIRIDPRYTPNRLLCTDRKNGRIVHMNLDGKLIGNYATNLRRPSAVDFFGDIAAVAEISGRVSLLDRAGHVIDTLGTNNQQDQINTNLTLPQQWQKGVFTAPHGLTFDKHGNLFITEWNKKGRILRFDLSH